MNSQKWLALLALLLENIPSIQMILQSDKKKEGEKNASSSNGSKN
jgi:hypothetical protein